MHMDEVTGRKIAYTVIMVCPTALRVVPFLFSRSNAEITSALLFAHKSVTMGFEVRWPRLSEPVELRR